MSEQRQSRGGLTGVVASFLTGNNALLLVVMSLTLGAAAVWLTPREEEPQIVVPMADVFVDFPGASAEEVEKLVATPLERFLWQIDGVEHVYSISHRDRAVVTVRFYVGEDRERSLVKLHNRIRSRIDEVPPGVTGWLIKPIEIDDVPIVTVTFHSRELDDGALRRVAEEVRARLDGLREISRTEISGGRRLEVSVELSPERMFARGVSLLAVHDVLAAADAAAPAGGFTRANRRIEVSAGPFLSSVADVENLVVGVHGGKPVYLRDVARVEARPEEAGHYTRIGFGPAASGSLSESTLPAVTLAVAKQKGSNAVAVAERVLERIDELKREIIPTGVEITVTRNHGVTADDKVNELLSALAFAMVSVIVVLVLSLGWRAGLVVALAVPMSFALALFVNYVFGFTINRVTLFALILTLGIVVDDPITLVENVKRHMERVAPGARKRNNSGRAWDATLAAVREVLPPIIMSTLTVVVSFLPMFFITGMMGPYMGPMAVTVPLTVSFSTVAALTVVPWAAYHLLRRRRVPETAAAEEPTETAPRSWLAQRFTAQVAALLDSPRLRLGLYGLVIGLLGFAALLVVLRVVPLKMLPFDNKSELQLVLDAPEGTSLETTDAAVREVEAYLATVPEIVDFESYVGTHSPIDFNGMVRHDYLRSGPHVADLRINLADKGRRIQGSHEIALRLRADLTAIAERHGVRLAIVESPPGPPVIATVVGEIYGQPDHGYAELNAAGDRVLERMRAEPGMVDFDHLAAADRTRLDFELDKEKAGLHGIDTRTVVETLRVALAGGRPATVHRAGERTPLQVNLRLSRADRSGRAELGRLAVATAAGELVALEEIGSFVEVSEDPLIYHKNLERVAYVVAEMVGRPPGEAILDLKRHFKEQPLSDGLRVEWGGEGEWEITVRVFRDLGLAFGAAMIGIYLLLVIQTSSFVMPLVIMSAIPLTAIGIMPGFWLLNLLVDRPVGGFDDPVFFTATAMIGMIALGGIVVRNSIVLIEFIQDSVARGRPLREAILESGAVRMRPILLTALTTAIGAVPITFDPVFSGLAWALIFGLIASTAFTLILVPVIYSRVAPEARERTSHAEETG